MRFKLTVVGIHIAKVQFVGNFDHGGLFQLQNDDRRG